MQADVSFLQKFPFVRPPIISNSLTQNLKIAPYIKATKASRAVQDLVVGQILLGAQTSTLKHLPDTLKKFAPAPAVQTEGSNVCETLADPEFGFVMFFQVIGRRWAPDSRDPPLKPRSVRRLKLTPAFFTRFHLTEMPENESTPRAPQICPIISSCFTRRSFIIVTRTCRDASVDLGPPSIRDDSTSVQGQGWILGGVSGSSSL